MDDIKEGIRYAFQTTNHMTLALSGSGHLAMECAVFNTVEPGESVLVCINGVWGERVAEIANRVGTALNPAVSVYTGRYWGFNRDGFNFFKFMGKDFLGENYTEKCSLTSSHVCVSVTVHFVCSTFPHHCCDARTSGPLVCISIPLKVHLWPILTPHTHFPGLRYTPKEKYSCVPLLRSVYKSSVSRKKHTGTQRLQHQ